jgi:hypothetical protein
MKSREDRIAALEERLKQLKNSQQRADARRRHLESKRHRQADLRRKILIGAVVLGLVEQGKLSERDLRAWLDQAVRRKDDRALFDL